MGKMIKSIKNLAKDILLKKDRLDNRVHFFVLGLQDIWRVDVMCKNGDQNPGLGCSGQRDFENSTLKVSAVSQINFTDLNVCKGQKFTTWPRFEMSTCKVFVMACF